MTSVADRAIEKSEFKKGILSYNDLQENVVVTMSYSPEYDAFKVVVAPIPVLNDRFNGKVAEIIMNYDEDDCMFYYESHSFIAIVPK